MQEQTDIRVFIADDHPWTIRQMYEFINTTDGMRVVGTASQGREAVQFFAHGNGGVDVVLIDIGMPKMNGLSVLEWIKKSCPQNLKVILITGLNGVFSHAEAVRHHADGFIAKSRRKTEFIDAIKRVYKGEVVILPEPEDGIELRMIGFSYLGAELVVILPELEDGIESMDTQNDLPKPNPEAHPGFSPLEIRILRMAVKEGMTSKEIALQTKLGAPYVDKIRLSLMAKLGAKNAAQLGAKALEQGLLN
jgi:DNA-binding NarL/FixJ family response regulator